MKRIFYLILFFVSLCYSSYAEIPKENLVGEYLFSNNADDGSGKNYHAVVYGASLVGDRFGDSESAYFFDGESAYIEIPSDPDFSIATTKELTISVWIAPDTLNFPNTENNYIHWMGKGESGKHEWVLRMYNLNDDDRPNRISCYAFNLSGGLGSGSYTQETLAKREWIHLAATYNYTQNRIRIYKNGVKKDEDFFTDYNVIPAYGNAPVRIGTRDFNSYFKGVIDDIRFYSRELSAAEIVELYEEESLTTKIIDQPDFGADFNIWVSDGKVQIKTNRESLLQIYTITGLLVLKEEITAGIVSKELPRGVYIVMLDGMAKKVVVD